MNQNKIILVLNAGSSSLKFSVFNGADKTTNPQSLINGQISGIGGDVEFTASDSQKNKLVNRNWQKNSAPNREELLEQLLKWLGEYLGKDRPIFAAGHRVVHGGRNFNKPMLLDNKNINTLSEFIPLAPLHQPHNIAPIISLQKSNPTLPQVACFDTAFHRTQSWLSSNYAIPRALIDEGVCRYGFHGLSYEYVSSTLKQQHPELAKGAVVICHLGNGSSLCAVKDGECVETTMGFSTLEGVPMGTRPGCLDVGILIYLMREKKMDLNSIEDLLYKKSGLLGVSGISNDMRELINDGSVQAMQAVDLFCYRVACSIGSLSVSMKGLSAIIFTAGIGENSPLVREKIINQLMWQGIKLDGAVNNTRGCKVISMVDSKVPVLVIPTNEELMIAKHTLTLLDR